MSDIMQSILGREIKAVLDNRDANITYRWRVDLHVMDKDYGTMKVLNIDYDDNPEENISTNVNINIVMEAGTYYKQILPNDHELEATIYKYTLMNGSGEINYEIPVTHERYRASIFNKDDESGASNVTDGVSEKLLNVTDVVEVQIQLLNKAIEQLRVMTVGGVYRQCTAEDLLTTCIQNAYRNIEVDEDRQPVGVDINGVSNTSEQESFVIPHGTRVIDLPDYLQNHSGGVFNSAMGSFIKDEFWYIYPKYDTTRFGNTQRTLTIIRVPPNKLPGSERTYRISGGSIIILATAEADKYNQSEVEQLNEGNGTRFASSDNFLESFTTTADNRTTATRGGRTSEFVGQHRTTGVDYAPIAAERITSNPYKHYSDITQRQGNLFSLVWENSDMDLILPGMLVKIMTLENEEVVEYEGVLLRSYHGISLRGKGLIGRSYITRTVLTVFTNALIKDELK